LKFFGVFGTIEEEYNEDNAKKMEYCSDFSTNKLFILTCKTEIKTTSIERIQSEF